MSCASSAMRSIPIGMSLGAESATEARSTRHPSIFFRRIALFLKIPTPLGARVKLKLVASGHRAPAVGTDWHPLALALASIFSHFLHPVYNGHFPDRRARLVLACRRPGYFLA